MAEVPEWVVYLTYALFVLGAILIIIGMIRVCWYCCVVRKEEKEQRKAYKNFYDNPSYFTAHLHDPWLKTRGLADGHTDDKDSLHDVNISEFLHTTREESARELSSQLNNSLAPENRTHIDSATVQSQAAYEEPNTNLILALKEKHTPPEDELSYGSNTQLVQEATPEDGYVSSRSEDTRAALSALDLATAGEDRPTDLDTSLSNDETEDVTPSTPHPNIATANEPLAGDSEMYVFSSNIYIQDSTEL